jgi:hypothetical protein
MLLPNAGKEGEESRGQPDLIRGSGFHPGPHKPRPRSLIYGFFYTNLPLGFTSKERLLSEGDGEGGGVGRGGGKGVGVTNTSTVYNKRV